MREGRSVVQDWPSGLAVGSADEAEDAAADGTDVILVRPTTDPDDVHGMLAARGVITEIGGTTSHAAVVSRELDRPCVVGCGVGSLMHLIGREITVNATTGEVLDGLLPLRIRRWRPIGPRRAEGVAHHGG